MVTRCTRHGRGQPRRSAGEPGAKHSLCFECFRAGSERTKARQEAWAQRALPFEAAEPGSPTGLTRALSDQEVAHRKRMLAYLESAARRRA